MKVFETEYAGNSTANRDIAHGLGGVPDYVVIKGSNAQDAIFKTSDSNFTTDTTLSWRQNSGSATEGIESMDATNIRIDTDSHVNASGTTYYMLVILFEGADGEVGTYEGNATDDRNITFGTVTAVRWIGIKNFDSTDSGAHKFKNDATTNASLPFHEFGGTRANEIQDLGTTTFQVGTGGEVNATGETYVYVAFGTDDGVADGSFAGNSTDNRDITTAGWDPEAVFMKSEQDPGAGYAVMSGDAATADTTYNYSFTASEVDQIQDTSLAGANGFQVGADDTVNASGTNYFWMQLRDTPAAGPASVKTRDTIAIASVKTVDTIAIASVKTIDTIS